MKTVLLCLGVSLAVCVGPLSAAEPQPQLTAADKVELQIRSHPRIHITAEMIPLLKERAATTHKVFYDKLLTNASAYCVEELPFPLGTGDDHRGFGDEMSEMAMAYVISGDAKFLEGCKRMVEPMLNSEDWGDNLGLVVGHQLAGMACMYDWLYDDLDPALRDRMKAKMHRQAEILYTYANEERVWWHDMYLQNWCHVPTAGLTYAAAALAGEDPEAEKWFRQADHCFTNVHLALSRDGNSEEGQAYMTYAWEFILRVDDISKTVFGRDHFDSDNLRNAPYVMIYCSLPNAARKSSGMVFGDGRRHIEWNGPTHMLFKSADLYNDPYAQSFAQWLVGKGIGYGSVACAFNMIWYNPRIEAKPFTDLPTARLLADSSTVYTRSGWEPDAMLVGFKCTSNTTDEVRKLFPGRPISGGHAHPDAASFQVYAFGQWLAIDGGYSLWKVTEEHNTIMVNGVGQLGGDSPWFDAKGTVYASPCRITNADFTPAMDYIRADASGIYKSKAALARFIRHVVYLKPHDLIIVDELEGKDESTFTWYVHAEDAITRDGDKFFFSKGDVNARVTWLAPSDYTADIFRQHLTFEPPVDLQDQTALAISNAAKAKSTMFVSMLNFYKGAEPETEAKLIGAENGVLTLDLKRGGKAETLAIDLNAGKAALK